MIFYYFNEQNEKKKLIETTICQIPKEVLDPNYTQSTYIFDRHWQPLILGTKIQEVELYTPNTTYEYRDMPNDTQLAFWHTQNGNGNFNLGHIVEGGLVWSYTMNFSANNINPTYFVVYPNNKNATFCCQLTYNTVSKRWFLSHFQYYDTLQGIQQEEWKLLVGATNYNSDVQNLGGNYTDEMNSDDVEFPNEPYVRYLDKAMINAYSVTDNQIEFFNRWLWTDNVLENLRKMFYTSPMQSILALRCYPFVTKDSQIASLIKLGNMTDSSAQGFPLVSEFRTFDFGYLTINEQYQGYNDYNTNISLYLPYATTIQLDTQEVMNSNLSLKARVNLITGDIIYYLKISKINDKGNIANYNSVNYQIKGTIGIDIPLSSVDYSSRVSSLVSTALAVGGGIATGIATGGTGAAIALGAIGSGVSGGVSALTSGGNVNRTGGFSPMGETMKVQYPYIFIHRIVELESNNFENFKGIPTPLNKFIGETKGFTKCRVVNVEQIAYANEQEKEEIRNLLLNGIYV